MSVFRIVCFALLIGAALSALLSMTAADERLNLYLDKITCQATNDNIGDDEIYFQLAMFHEGGPTCDVTGPSGPGGVGATTWEFNAGKKNEKFFPVGHIGSIKLPRGKHGIILFNLYECDAPSTFKLPSNAKGLLNVLKAPRAAGAGITWDDVVGSVPHKDDDLMGIVFLEGENADGKLVVRSNGGEHSEVILDNPLKPVVRMANDDGKYTVYLRLALYEDGAGQPPAAGAAIDLSTLKGKQQALAALGYKLSDDGLDGPMTQAAARKFQTDHGIEVVGKLGPKTTAKIRELLKEKNIAFVN